MHHGGLIDSKRDEMKQMPNYPMIKNMFRNAIITHANNTHSEDKKVMNSSIFQIIYSDHRMIGCNVHFSI